MHSLLREAIDLNTAIKRSMEKNLKVQASRLNESVSERLQATAFDIAKTNFTAEYGKVNSISNDNRIGFSQTFNFPTVYSNQRKMLEANLLAARASTELDRAGDTGQCCGCCFMPMRV